MVDFSITLGEILRCLYSELSRFFLPSSESVLSKMAIFPLSRFFLTSSESVLSKMAIFPETRKGNVHISNESARSWSLREANV